MNNNQEKSSYKETGDKVTSTLGAIGAGLESTAKEVSKNLDISNLGKTIIKWSPKPISSTLNVHSIATAQGEKGVFTEAYKMGVSSVTSGLGGGVGVVGCAVIPFINTATPVCAGVGAGFGNWLGNEIAEATADIAYPIYKATKDFFTDSNPQQSHSPTSPQGISFPYSSIIYLTTIKALKETLKEYLPKAKKIILYTPNPFVSLYTSSPSYIFNSNLSFFNPHLQYLLTSKDTQQWLYDTLFSLARDNREIIVYEWGGSVEELDSKESQANKKDLDSKDTNQSTNIQKQTKQLGKESNKELKENQKGLESKNFYSKIQSFLCYDSKKRYA